MNRRELDRLSRELDEFLETMTEGMGRAERRASLRAYVTGLLLDGERKSVEPIAARLVDTSDEVESMRQRLLGCLSESEWRESALLDRLAVKLQRELPGVEALVVDDTGFPKKGRHSVGVARQYSGTLGRTDNCQVGTSLHLAGESGSGCIAFTLYLPEEWAEDFPRRRKTGVPDQILFRRKWQISLEQIDTAIAAGIRKHVVLADAGYGDAVEFRDGLVARGLEYVVGVQGTAVVWPPGSNPKIPPRRPRRGRPQTRYRDEQRPPISLQQLASTLSYRAVKWREGSRGWQVSRFAAARVRTAHRHSNNAPPGAEQWLLCEWHEAQPAPHKFYLSTLPADASLRALVRLAKLRWRVERDYQEMKQEIGLDHFEGRSWRGFHRHAALCAVAHAFLVIRRALFPPEDDALDATDGAQSAAAGAVASGRHLPALSDAVQSQRAASRAITSLI